MQSKFHTLNRHAYLYFSKYAYLFKDKINFFNRKTRLYYLFTFLSCSKMFDP